LILQESMRVNDKDALDPHVNVDTTVQEQNITYPTDAKLHHKIIQKCKAIARREGIERRRSYSRTLKKLGQGRRFRHHPKNKAKALKAERKVKTIAGRFVQELERKLSAESKYQRDLVLFYQVWIQKRDSKKRLYSLHEPAVVCISKGKEHKKYEFGNKVSIAKTDSGVIVEALSCTDEYDGHTLEPTLEQVKRLVGRTPRRLEVDRGYRGTIRIGDTEIVIPSKPERAMSYYSAQETQRGPQEASRHRARNRSFKNRPSAESQLLQRNPRRQHQCPAGCCSLQLTSGRKNFCKNLASLKNDIFSIQSVYQVLEDVH
jgi:IS5 family transposase